MNKTETRGVTVEISEKWLEQYELPANMERVRHWDSKLTGFGVIVGRRRVSFVVQRRVGRKQRLVTLGQWAPSKQRGLDVGLRNRTMTVLQARSKAIEALGMMRGGESPGGAPKSDSPTLSAAADLHLARMRKEGASSRGMSTVELELERFLSDWKPRPLADISRTECRERHEKITADAGPYVANRVMRHLRAVWNTALKEMDLPANPTIAVHWNEEERRQEPIPWDKLPAWRLALNALSETRRDYNLVVLLTGLRRMDAATIRHEHLDLKQRTLHRPNPKGGKDRAFTVPVSRECVKIFKRRIETNFDDQGWVFPTDSMKDRGCIQCAALGLPPHKKGVRTHIAEPKEDDEIIVSPHRLRDTYTTALAALQPAVSPYVIDVLTNHRPPRGSVTAGYIGLATDDVRDAQERVTRFLMAKMKAKKAK